MSIARLWSPEAADTVRDLAQGACVVLNYPFLAPYAPVSSPYVVSTQNVESSVLNQLRSAGSPRERLERRWDAWTLPRCERALCASPRATVIAVSDDDLRSLGGRGVVIPNGTDVPADVPSVVTKGTTLFVGSLDWPPNRLAVDWWANAVAPLLPRDSPPLTVVGRGAPGAASHGGTVVFVGEVADVGTYLADASVVAIPLLHGGGTRLKLLEAMAWGRPVVSTSKGAEGIPVRDGRDVLLADTAADFALAVNRARSDPALAARLSANARAFAARYSWDLIVPRFVDVVSAVAAEASVVRR